MRSRRNITSMQNDYILQKERAEKRAAKKRKLLRRRLTVFFVFTAIVSYFLISTLISQAAQIKEIEEEKVELEKTLAKVEREQSMLEDEVVKLNDDEYIGKLIRSEYFLSENGEIIFSIPKKEEKVSY